MVFLLPGDSDFINLWDGLEDILSKIPVISLRSVSLSLKLKGRVLKQHVNIIMLKFLQTKTVVNNTCIRP